MMKVIMSLDRIRFALATQKKIYDVIIASIRIPVILVRSSLISMQKISSFFLMISQ